MRKNLASVIVILGLFGSSIASITPASAIFGLSTCEKVKKQVLDFEKKINNSASFWIKYQGKKISNADYTEITELAMKSITALVEELRGEKAPGKLFDPREHGMAEYGNFKRKTPKRQVGDA